MTPPDLPPPPPSRLGKPTSSFSRPTGRWNPPTVTNYVMETEDLFVPLDARQVWVKSSTVVSRKKWVPSSSDLELLSLNRLKQQQACEDNCKAAVKDVSWRKKWVAVWMDVVSRKWVACTGLFIVLMLVMAAIPHDEDYHDFADQRTLFLGIPNTLNVISTIPLFFVGLAGLILNHCKSYFRLCSQGDLYTLFFSGVIAAGFGSSCHHLNPKNGTLFLHTLPMMTAFTSFEAIFIIESFDDWARTKSLASTSYWLWAAGLYVLARVEEVADKQIYRWTLQIVSGHTLGHLCASMVPLFLILMLAKRTRLIEEERHMIPVHHQLKLTIMVCLLVPKMICLWVPKIQCFFMRYLGLVLLGLMGGCQNELPPTQLTDHVVALNQVSVTICEISLLMWEFGAHSVNQAKLSDETAMLETPIRAWESVSRFFMHYLGLVLLGLMGGCQNELPPTQLTDHVVALNQVSVTICEISLLMWQFGARSVNQAKLSDETAMLETPIRAWESVSRIHGLWGMDIYKNKVLQFLQSERSDDSFFGLWGVRGVGKTRLLSLIAASYADSFRHILFLDGGSSVMAMQYHLASFLDLDWEKMSSLDEHSRAKTITEYLVQDSFLLLLDNVPYIPYPDLVAVGLPVPLGCRQKVVLASRSQRMCGLMGCTISNIVQMKCLGDEDAWRLFKYHVGVEITEADAEIYDYAKKMVWACGGLPRGILALGKGVARVTYSGKGLFTWQFAYNQTMGRIRHPEEMPEIAYVLI